MIHVFGEAHSDPADILRINGEIIKLTPDVILHELLYEDRCDSKVEIDKRLMECKEGGVCDPRINRDIYLLGRKLGCKLIGIDLDFVDKKLTTREKFRIREAHMLTMINKCLVEFKGQDMVIVIGDAHLRSSRTIELGPESRIYTELSRRSDVKFYRSASHTKEVE